MCHQVETKLCHSNKKVIRSVNARVCAFCTWSIAAEDLRAEGSAQSSRSGGLCCGHSGREKRCGKSDNQQSHDQFRKGRVRYLRFVEPAMRARLCLGSMPEGAHKRVSTH